ncbi:MAG TPA: hypothetical protein PLN86_06700 [Candidatus Hydrogenedentes bacterium]|nr:hypothetical protein [Candidatus Hydrogenedentota bacterium]
MRKEESSLSENERDNILVRGCLCSTWVERREEQGRLAWCDPRGSVGDVQAADFSAAFFVGFYDVACAVPRVGRR